jgi:ParB family chromosome partitioning protein
VSTTPADQVTHHVPLERLDAPGLDLRMERDPEKLEQITASIQRHGILQPLIVLRTGERFEIIDGFTRYVCAQRAGLSTVPCYIRETRDASTEGIKYDTATMRLELTPAEEATFFHALFVGECQQDLDAVAARVGRSRTYVDDRVQLLLGDEQVFEAVKAEQIRLGVAKLLNSMPDEGWRRYYLRHAIKEGATVTVVTGWIQDWRKTYEALEQPPPRPIASSASVVTQDDDPNRCYCCRQIDPREIPQFVSIHRSCLMRILDPLLAAYRGETHG